MPAEPPLPDVAPLPDPALFEPLEPPDDFEPPPLPAVALPPVAPVPLPPDCSSSEPGALPAEQPASAASKMVEAILMGIALTLGS
jgi:hypothetical protein